MHQVTNSMWGCTKLKGNVPLNVCEEEEETNEGKLPPWLEKKAGKEGDDDKEVVEEDDDDEKNESLDNKDWWDNSLYERLVRKWTK